MLWLLCEHQLLHIVLHDVLRTIILSLVSCFGSQLFFFEHLLEAMTFKCFFSHLFCECCLNEWSLFFVSCSLVQQNYCGWHENKSSGRSERANRSRQMTPKQLPKKLGVVLGWFETNPPREPLWFSRSATISLHFHAISSKIKPLICLTIAKGCHSNDVISMKTTFLSQGLF